MNTPVCFHGLSHFSWSSPYLFFLLPNHPQLSSSPRLFKDDLFSLTAYLSTCLCRTLHIEDQHPWCFLNKIEVKPPDDFYKATPRYMKFRHPKKPWMKSLTRRSPVVFWGVLTLTLGWLPLEGVAAGQVLVARQDVGQLTGAEPVTVGKWVGRPATKHKIPHQIKSDLKPLEDLIGTGGTASVGDGVASGEVPIRDLGRPRIATRLPRELKSAVRTVRVEIPAGEGEPVASVVTVGDPGGAVVSRVSPPVSTPVSPTPVSPSLSTPISIAVQKPEERILTIRPKGEDGSFEISPQMLVFSEIGEVVKIDIESKELVIADVRFFVRNPAVSELIELKDPKGSPRLKGLAVGTTELYVVSHNQMAIVPIEVRSQALVTQLGPAQRVLKPLSVPAEILQLSGVGGVADMGPGGPIMAAMDPGLVDSSVSLSEALPQSQDLQGEEPPAPPPIQRPAQRSLHQSIAETEQFIKETEAEAKDYETRVQAFEATDVTIQVVDDRTLPIQNDGSVSTRGPVYPIPGALVEVVGTEFRAQTDGTGHLVIKGVPRGSRMLIRVRDPAGSVVDGIAEVKAEDGVHRIRTLRSFAFDIAQRLTGVTQIAGTASFCGKIQSALPPETKFKSFRVGVQGGAPRESFEGPFYYNESGYLDTSLREAGPSGRFCLFNIRPGPWALDIEAKGASGQSSSKWTFPMGAYGSFHQESLVVLNQGLSFKTNLVSMGTAHEQLSRDPATSHRLRTVDFVEAFPVGYSKPMAQPREGQLENEDGLDSVDGVGTYYVESPEFENALYQVNDEDSKQSVTPLLPRGFVEDMALFAQISPDPLLGTVYTEFSHFKNLEGSVNIKLINERGEEAGTSWYISDQPLTKTMFFNVNPGRYSLVVETKDGDWIDADLVMVYSDTVSHVRLGQKIFAKESSESQ